MSTGAKRERVTIQQKTRLPNGQGGWLPAVWSDVPNAKAWAEIIGLSGDESIKAMVERNVSRWRVIMRKRNDIAPASRLLWGDLILDIISVLPLPSDPRSEILLICESGLSADGS